MDHVFGVISQISLPYPRSSRFLQCSSESFLVLHFTFWSMIHFKLIFVKDATLYLDSFFLMWMSNCSSTISSKNHLAPFYDPDLIHWHLSPGWLQFPNLCFLLPTLQSTVCSPPATKMNRWNVLNHFTSLLKTFPWLLSSLRVKSKVPWYVSGPKWSDRTSRKLHLLCSPLNSFCSSHILLASPQRGHAHPWLSSLHLECSFPRHGMALFHFLPGL